LSKKDKISLLENVSFGPAKKNPTSNSFYLSNAQALSLINKTIKPTFFTLKKFNLFQKKKHLFFLILDSSKSVKSDPSFYYW